MEKKVRHIFENVFSEKGVIKNKSKKVIRTYVLFSFLLLFFREDFVKL